jgi:hypothetical protein
MLIGTGGVQHRLLVLRTNRELTSPALGVRTQYSRGAGRAGGGVEHHFIARVALLVLFEHIAVLLQPNADVLDIRRAGVVWRLLRRAWHAAGEPDTFEQFADEQLAAVDQEAA